MMLLNISPAGPTKLAGPSRVGQQQADLPREFRGVVRDQNVTVDPHVQAGNTLARGYDRQSHGHGLQDLVLDTDFDRDWADRNRGARHDGAQVGNVAGDSNARGRREPSNARRWTAADDHEARVRPFKVLKGVEANIRADGAIDVDDELLAELDWVVASLHHAFDKSPTERVLAAIDHPHVDCIGHLTGRKLNRRAGADVDIEQVVARAAETRTALEINSQPDRLDMRDVHARLAGEAGVLVPVTTDAHSTGALGYRELGVAQARRAWLTKEQVLNTRPWREIAKLRP